VSGAALLRLPCAEPILPQLARFLCLLCSRAAGAGRALWPQLVHQRGRRGGRAQGVSRVCCCFPKTRSLTSCSDKDTSPRARQYLRSLAASCQRSSATSSRPRSHSAAPPRARAARASLRPPLATPTRAWTRASARRRQALPRPRPRGPSSARLELRPPQAPASSAACSKPVHTRPLPASPSGHINVSPS